MSKFLTIYDLEPGQLLCLDYFRSELFIYLKPYEPRAWCNDPPASPHKAQVLCLRDKKIENRQLQYLKKI